MSTPSASVAPSSIRVGLRARPLLDRERDTRDGATPRLSVRIEGNQATLVGASRAQQRAAGTGGTGVSAASSSSSSASQEDSKAFVFDHCFWSVGVEGADAADADQRCVYESLGRPVLAAALEGYNACIMAYGQTGAGKSYSMIGTAAARGIVPRLCEDLFEHCAALSREAELRGDGSESGASRGPRVSHVVEVGYLEIYNERVRDLLAAGRADAGTAPAGAGAGAAGTLRVREHPVTGPFVEGLTKVSVSSYADVEALLDVGNASRVVAATRMNEASSRSHAIFTICFSETVFADVGAESERTSKIHLVDLAGSERASVSGLSGLRLVEGGNINKSLTTLGLVISALATAATEKKQPFVPYRDSVLTWLLKDSLGGNSKTVLLAAISPSADSYEETASTLRFASRAKRVINNAVINEDPNLKLIRELRQEVASLQSQLSLLTAQRGPATATPPDAARLRPPLPPSLSRQDSEDPSSLASSADASTIDLEALRMRLESSRKIAEDLSADWHESRRLRLEALAAGSSGFATPVSRNTRTSRQRPPESPSQREREKEKEQERDRSEATTPTEKRTPVVAPSEPSPSPEGHSRRASLVVGRGDSMMKLTPSIAHLAWLTCDLSVSGVVVFPLTADETLTIGVSGHSDAHDNAPFDVCVEAEGDQRLLATVSLSSDGCVATLTPAEGVFCTVGPRPVSGASGLAQGDLVMIEGQHVFRYSNASAPKQTPVATPERAEHSPSSASKGGVDNASLAEPPTVSAGSGESAAPVSAPPDSKGEVPIDRKADHSRTGVDGDNGHVSSSGDDEDDAGSVYEEALADPVESPVAVDVVVREGIDDRETTSVEPMAMSLQDVARAFAAVKEGGVTAPAQTAVDGAEGAENGASARAKAHRQIDRGTVEHSASSVQADVVSASVGGGVGAGGERTDVHWGEAAEGSQGSSAIAGPDSSEQASVVARSSGAVLAAAHPPQGERAAEGGVPRDMNGLQSDSLCMADSEGHDRGATPSTGTLGDDSLSSISLSDSRAVLERLVAHSAVFGAARALPHLPEDSADGDIAGESNAAHYAAANSQGPTASTEVGAYANGLDARLARSALVGEPAQSPGLQGEPSGLTSSASLGSLRTQQPPREGPLSSVSLGGRRTSTPTGNLEREISAVYDRLKLSSTQVERAPIVPRIVANGYVRPPAWGPSQSPAAHAQGTGGNHAPLSPVSPLVRGRDSLDAAPLSPTGGLVAGGASGAVLNFPPAPAPPPQQQPLSAGDASPLGTSPSTLSPGLLTRGSRVGSGARDLSSLIAGAMDTRIASGTLGADTLSRLDALVRRFERGEFPPLQVDAVVREIVELRLQAMLQEDAARARATAERRKREEIGGPMYGHPQPQGDPFHAARGRSDSNPQSQHLEGTRTRGDSNPQAQPPEGKRSRAGSNPQPQPLDGTRARGDSNPQPQLPDAQRARGDSNPQYHLADTVRSRAGSNSQPSETIEGHVDTGTGAESVPQSPTPPATPTGTISVPSTLSDAPVLEGPSETRAEGGSSIVSVTISAVQSFVSPSGDRYNAFAVRVRCVDGEWVTWRRYSHFEALRGAVTSKYPDIASSANPVFPPKKRANALFSLGSANQSASFLEGRRQRLETYLSMVVTCLARRPPLSEGVTTRRLIQVVPFLVDPSTKFVRRPPLVE